MRILIVCGGTGGHIFPAIALAKELKKRGYSDIIFAIDDNAKAKDAINAAGFSFSVTDVPKMPYGLTLKWLLFLPKIMISGLKAEALIFSIKPDVTVGFGAYISGPLLLAAKSQRIKTLIHEQNINLGRANRMLASKVDKVCFSFDHDLIKKSKKYCLTGNPTREELIEDYNGFSKDDALLRLGLKSGKKTVLVMGGSKGASAINDLIINIVKGLSESEKAAVQFIHITGDDGLKSASEIYKNSGLSHWVNCFCNKMGILYKAADLMVCRSGATTIAEACLLGVPAIFIPYPWAGKHQNENAAAITRSTRCVMLEQSGLTPLVLKENIFQLINDDARRDKISSAMRSFAVPDALKRLADRVEEIIRC